MKLTTAQNGCRTTEEEVAHKSPHRDGYHNPTIIRHEDQPVHRKPPGPSLQNLAEDQIYSHDHKRIKVLHPVEYGLDKVRPPRHLDTVLSCPKERRSLRIRFAAEELNLSDDCSHACT